ncbi:crotonase/enoyl-CoA hydratase family protein [Gordonia lacunae]|uniref:Enoyl-CoA hydratase n=1 Tax=Gordonia lacunae TaxID=417102 RepID=A0A243Q8P3_9ACTN|nr:crotonase/enoyl-CoA hydratase family protein [Gordonia lacunae]OUC78083.1 enoyl-CoA hydratase [Gordonia lacunae]
MTSTEFAAATVTVERDGHVLLIGLNRPEKHNAFTREMISDLSRAYALLESDDDLRVGVLYGHGTHFTAGLDLIDVAPLLTSGASPFAAGGRDPWRLDGTWTKPIVAVAHGWAMTLGIELLLAADIRVAAGNVRFTQMEVRRGIYPFGGATFRFPRECGWGNAMRWILTGDEFGAEEAQRIGLVQEVADDFRQALQRAKDIATTIATSAAPRSVQSVLESAHVARQRGDQASIDRLLPTLGELLTTSDAAEGVQSFVERRPAVFTGH